MEVLSDGVEVEEAGYNRYSRPESKCENNDDNNNNIITKGQARRSRICKDFIPSYPLIIFMIITRLLSGPSRWLHFPGESDVLIVTTEPG